MATSFNLEKPSFRQNIEGEIAYGKNKLFRIVQTDDNFDRTNPWLITLSRESGSCLEFNELKKLIEEKPWKEGKYEL